MLFSHSGAAHVETPTNWTLKPRKRAQHENQKCRKMSTPIGWGGAFSFITGFGLLKRGSTSGNPRSPSPPGTTSSPLRHCLDQHAGHLASDMTRYRTNLPGLRLGTSRNRGLSNACRLATGSEIHAVTNWLGNLDGMDRGRPEICALFPQGPKHWIRRPCHPVPQGPRHVSAGVRNVLLASLRVRRQAAMDWPRA